MCVCDDGEWKVLKLSFGFRSSQYVYTTRFSMTFPPCSSSSHVFMRIISNNTTLITCICIYVVQWALTNQLPSCNDLKCSIPNVITLQHLGTNLCCQIFIKSFQKLHKLGILKMNKNQLPCLGWSTRVIVLFSIGIKQMVTINIFIFG